MLTVYKLDIHCDRWRNYDVTFVLGTCWYIDAVVSCIMWCNLRQLNI